MGFVQARERADSRERERERDETWRSWPGWPLLLSVRVRVRQRRYGFSAGKDDQCFSTGLDRRMSHRILNRGSNGLPKLV